MPLNVSLDVNGTHIAKIKISRVEDFKHEQADHIYSAALELPSGEYRRVRLSHTYSDGALILLRRALYELTERKP